MATEFVPPVKYQSYLAIFTSIP